MTPLGRWSFGFSSNGRSSRKDASEQFALDGFVRLDDQSPRSTFLASDRMIQDSLSVASVSDLVAFQAGIGIDPEISGKQLSQPDGRQAEAPVSVVDEDGEVEEEVPVSVVDEVEEVEEEAPVSVVDEDGEVEEEAPVSVVDEAEEVEEEAPVSVVDEVEESEVEAPGGSGGNTNAENAEDSVIDGGKPGQGGGPQGNNGFGNGDQEAPGVSGGNTNAENAEDPIINGG